MYFWQFPIMPLRVAIRHSSSCWQLSTFKGRTITSPDPIKLRFTIEKVDRSPNSRDVCEISLTSSTIIIIIWPYAGLTSPDWLVHRRTWTFWLSTYKTRKLPQSPGALSETRKLRVEVTVTQSQQWAFEYKANKQTQTTQVAEGLLIIKAPGISFSAPSSIRNLFRRHRYGNTC